MLSIPIVRSSCSLAIMAPVCLPVSVVVPLSLSASVSVPSPALLLSAGTSLSVSATPFLSLIGPVFVPALPYTVILFKIASVLLGEPVLLGEGGREGGAGYAVIRLALGAHFNGALDWFVGLRSDSSTSAPTSAATVALTPIVVIGGRAGTQFSERLWGGALALGGLSLLRAE